ncbi:hypothetical protein M6D81_07945 [Paenibacillus sp. J5C_2022]|uniref:DUF6916 family protein n=1 Tax=Paenibacillus sp. J5C2022 TaxID=2977129 RepID=UPI0021D2F23D|nr:hypothetical protein [Paenibacillus sp. J5C2022]MCU6708647.1 hypothetical protein [Paenibacillus sp. J5C2022]
MLLSTEEQWQQELNTPFTARIAESFATFRLVEVKSLGCASGYRTYSLLFQGPQEPLLEQQMISLSHEERGDCNLFLVPIAREQSGVIYEAVMNNRDEEADSCQVIR